MTQPTDMVSAAQNAGLIKSAAQSRAEITEMFNPNRPGFEEGIDQKHMTIPRAKLLQGLSQEVKDDPRTFIAGMIINSITKEQISKTFIPIRKLRTNYVRFNARDRKDPSFVPEFEEGGVVWRSDDPEDPRVKEQGAWGPNGEPPVATEFMNFLCYFDGFSIPLVLSFARSSFQTGKDFNTMAVAFGGAMYSRKYTITALSKRQRGNDFYVLQVRPAGKCSEDELAIGKLLSDTFTGQLKVHEEDEATE